jgi:hypothetical protein
MPASVKYICRHKEEEEEEEEEERECLTTHIVDYNLYITKSPYIPCGHSYSHYSQQKSIGCATL